MKVLMLGAPRAVQEESWKDGLAYAMELAGWDIQHIPAINADTDQVVRSAKHCDLLLWAYTHGHEPQGNVLRMLAEVRDSGTRTAGVHLDLYWSIPVREQRVFSLPFFKCEHIFTADGSNQSLWKNAGVNHHWLPPAISERFFGRAEITEVNPRTFYFVGGYVPSIHGDHRKSLLDWAKRTYQRNFRHIGLGSYRRRVYGDRLTELYHKAYGVIGDSAPMNCYWSDRIPRTLGRGAVLAYPETPGLAEWGFDDQNMILYPRYQFNVIREKFDSLTSCGRKDLIEASLTTVQERHLWTHRINQIRETVFL